MDGAENRYITISYPLASQWPTGSSSSLRYDLLLWGEFLLRSFPLASQWPTGSNSSLRYDLLLWGEFLLRSFSPKKQSMPQDYSCKHDSPAALTVFFHCDSSNIYVTCYTLSGFLSSFYLSLFGILLSGIHFQA